MVALPAFVVLIGLGFWQLERRAWKHELLGDLQARLAEPPLSELPAASDLPALEFRRAQLRGRFIGAREQLLVGRSRQDRSGYGVFAPFELADGRIVFVDRGWIPLSAKAAPDWRAEVTPATIDGVIRAVREDEPAAGTAIGNEHYRLNLGALGRQAGVDRNRVLPIYVVATGPARPGVLPIPRAAALEVSDNHLQYAVTWFALAAALAGVYVLASRRDSRVGAQ